MGVKRTTWKKVSNTVWWRGDQQWSARKIGPKSFWLYRHQSGDRVRTVKGFETLVQAMNFAGSPA